MCGEAPKGVFPRADPESPDLPELCGTHGESKLHGLPHLSHTPCGDGSVSG